MIVADANVVIAAADPGHVHHSEAQDIVRAYGRRSIVLHSLTLAEVLVGPARAGAQAEVRARLERAGFTSSLGGDPDPEALALVRATTSLKMPDACVLATAEQLGASIATFDRRVAREARARGTTVLGAPDLPTG